MQACCMDGVNAFIEGYLKRYEPYKRYWNYEDGCVLNCECENRARLMGTLSELMLELGARYDDGIRLSGPRYELHISPSAVSSAVRVAVKSDDAEFARSLCLAAGDVVKKLEM